MLRFEAMASDDTITGDSLGNTLRVLGNTLAKAAAGVNINDPSYDLY